MSYWQAEPEFDSLDFGLDIEMVSEKNFSFTWGSEFYQYGISLKAENLSQIVPDANKIEVTNISRWTDKIGLSIVDAKITWSWVKESGLFKKKIYYPQELTLTFSDCSKVIISALEIREDEPLSLADNITIFFNEHTAKQYLNGT